MKRLISLGAAVAAITAFTAAPASAATGNAYGQQIKTTFGASYGQLLNFNGLTHAVLVVWPMLASVYVLSVAARHAGLEPG